MTRKRGRLLLPVALAAVLAALLVCAGTAAAELRTGEAGAPEDLGIPKEVDIVHATAGYESTTGAINFVITTAAEPRAEFGNEPSRALIWAGLVTTAGPCTWQTIEAGEFSFPAIQIEAPYSGEPTAIKRADSRAGSLVTVGTATRTVSDRDTTISGTVAELANQGFNCAFVAVPGLPGGLGAGALAFPIAVPTVTLPTQTTTAPSTAPSPPPPAPTPSAAPAALSIVKSKPLKLKVGKWKTAKVTLTNGGGTSTRPGSLRVKAPAGVLVKPEKQRLPVLSPGGSWTVSVRVQLTAKAKKKSTLTLTGSAGSVTAKGSLVLKALAG